MFHAFFYARRNRILAIMDASLLPKRPRHYAAEILALKSQKQRRSALKKVPEEWRDWVKELVLDKFYKTQYLREYHAHRPTRPF